jgi:hypothetical protein
LAKRRGRPFLFALTSPLRLKYKHTFSFYGGVFVAGKLEDLFAMKWMLPEHRAMLYEYEQEKELIKAPVLEQDELTQFSYTINESMHEDQAVTIRWWKHVKDDLGTIEEAWGWVKTIDYNRKQLKLVNDWEFWWIDFHRIVSVIGS